MAEHVFQRTPADCGIVSHAESAAVNDSLYSMSATESDGPSDGPSEGGTEIALPGSAINAITVINVSREGNTAAPPQAAESSMSAAARLDSAMSAFVGRELSQREAAFLRQTVAATAKNLADFAV